MKYGAWGWLGQWILLWAMVGLIVQSAFGGAYTASTADASLDYTAAAIAISPSGDYLVANDEANALVRLYRRDVADGSLTLLESYADGFTPGESFVGSRDAVWSATDFIYLSSFADDAIAVWRLNRDTQSLEFFQLAENSEFAEPAMNGPVAIDLRPDGSAVVVASILTDDVCSWNVESATGELSAGNVVRNGVRSATGFSIVRDVVVSPDGNHVYAAGAGEDAICIMRFEPTDGQLAYRETIHGVPGVIDGIGSVRALAVSPDGLRLVAASGQVDALAAFDRDPSTGRLTYLETIYNDGETIIGFGGGAISFSHDGRKIFASDLRSARLGVFEYDAGEALTYMYAVSVSQNPDGDGAIALCPAAGDVDIYCGVPASPLQRVSRTHSPAFAGKVLNAANGKGVKGATVVLEGPETVFDITDPAGRFSIEAFRTGEYTITAFAAGYVAASVVHTLDAENGPIEIEVLFEELEVEPAISGIVVSSDGMGAVPAARVELWDGDEAVSACYTDANGAFEFASTSPGAGLMIGAPGYDPTQIPASVAEGSEIALEVSASISPAAVSGNIAGWQKDTVGPIDGGRIALLGSRHLTYEVEGSGSFVLDGLPEGAYVLHATGTRHGATRTMRTLQSNAAAVVSLTLDVAPTPEDVDTSGVLDSADIQHVINDVLGTNSEFSGDVNGDRVSDAQDIQSIILAVLDAS